MLWFVGTAVAYTAFYFIQKEYTSFTIDKEFWAVLGIFSIASVVPIFTENPLRSGTGVLTVFTFAIVGTLVISSAFSRGVMSTSGDNLQDVLTKVTFKDGTNKEIIAVMSGDRGFLYYDPKIKRTTLARWDDIKGLDWSAQ